MGNLETKTKFISLAQAAKRTGYTPEYLNSLARKDVLPAEKIGRNWFVSEQDLQSFEAWIHSHHYPKPGRKKGEPESPIKVVVPIQTESVELIEIAGAASVREKFSQTEKKSFWPRLVTGAVFLLIFFLISLSSLWVVSFFLRDQESQPEELATEISEDTFISRDEKGTIISPGKVMGEETGVASSIAASEDFYMKEISFGGMVLASSDEERLSLEIMDFKTKVFLTRDGKEAQALISWKTNKLAVSEMSYAKINSPEEKKMQEENFAFNHSVILAKLDLDATYTITVQAQDRQGNIKMSDKFSVYTGSKAVSVFDLIVKEMNAVFGWAMKK